VAAVFPLLTVINPVLVLPVVESLSIFAVALFDAPAAVPRYVAVACANPPLLWIGDCCPVSVPATELHVTGNGEPAFVLLLTKTSRLPTAVSTPLEF